MIAIDTETTMMRDAGRIRTSRDVPDLVCYTWHGGDADKMTWSKGLATWEEPHVLRTLLDGGDTVVFHNAPFDLAVLAKAYPELKESLVDAITERRILDTMVLYQMRRPGDQCNRSLADACRFVLGGAPKKDAVRTSFTRETPLTPEQKDYAVADAVWTYKLAEALLRYPFGALDQRPDFFTSAQVYAELAGDFNADREFSAAAAWQAFQCSAVGLGLDPERLATYHTKYQEIETARLAELLRYGLARLKRRPKSPTKKITPHPDWKLDRKWQAVEGTTDRLYRVQGGQAEAVDADVALIEAAVRGSYEEFARALGLSPGEEGRDPFAGEYPVSPTGNLSLDAKFWGQHKDEMPAPVRAHYELGKARKYLSTYFRPLLEQRAERVYPTFSVAGTATGRWACWRPNLQNQPKAIRDMYVSPHEGEVLISADYKSLEMYTACEAFHRLGLGHGPLRLLLDRGGDTHRQTAALMFNKPEHEINDHERFVAKTANFSLLGGQGARKFAAKARQAGLDWSLTDAAHIRDLWFGVFTDARSFLELFRIDPWSLCPPDWNRRAWLDLNEVATEPWPSRFELSKALNDGRLYECRLPSGRVVPNRRFSQAANLFFQGIGAEVVTRAFNLCCERALSVCNVVHDSITITAPAKMADDQGAALVNAMQEAQAQICNCGVTIPLPEYTKGDHWA